MYMYLDSFEKIYFLTASSHDDDHNEWHDSLIGIDGWHNDRHKMYILVHKLYGDQVIQLMTYNRK